MRLTAFAVRMAPRVRDLLSDIEATLLAHHSFDPGVASRTFRIATNDYCGAVLMPELLARIRRSAPGVVIELHPYRGAAPMQELARGELDLAVGTFLASEVGLQKRMLYEETFQCLVRRRHPRVGQRWSLERFVALDHILVTAPGDGPGVIDHALAELGLRRRVVARVPHFLVAPALVARTDLVVTLPSHLARLALAAYDVRLLEPPLPVPAFAVEMAWHPLSNDDEASRWLRAELEASASVQRRARV